MSLSASPASPSASPASPASSSYADDADDADDAGASAGSSSGSGSDSERESEASVGEADAECESEASATSATLDTDAQPPKRQRVKSTALSRLASITKERDELSHELERTKTALAESDALVHKLNATIQSIGSLCGASGRARRLTLVQVHNTDFGSLDGGEARRFSAPLSFPHATEKRGRGLSLVLEQRRETELVFQAIDADTRQPVDEGLIATNGSVSFVFKLLFADTLKKVDSDATSKVSEATTLPLLNGFWPLQNGRLKLRLHFRVLSSDFAPRGARPFVIRACCASKAIDDAARRQLTVQTPAFVVKSRCRKL